MFSFKNQNAIANSNDNYKQKYLKYKNKYLSLKVQLGGSQSLKLLERIKKNIEEIQKDDSLFFLGQSEEDKLLLRGFIHGPQGSPYEGGSFNFELNIPPEYPWQEPTIKFTTKILHPNIHESGELGKLKYIGISSWIPNMTFKNILETIHNCLKNPSDNPSLHINHTYENLTKEQYFQKAKEWTEKYAM
jgi:ubiquitin-protein ligase